MAYNEGRADQRAALEKATKKNQNKSEEISKDAQRLLWRILGQQWGLLLVGFPFMFTGSLIEFLVPNYVGQILNKFREGNFDGKDGVYEILATWLIMLAISAVCTFVRDFVFGITS